MKRFTPTYSVRCTRCGGFGVSKDPEHRNFLCFKCLAARTNEQQANATSRIMDEYKRASNQVKT